MRNLILIFLLLVSSNTWSATEISTTGTNLGVGTTSTKNALSVRSSLAVGSATYTNITAPSNGAIFEGNVGIGTPTPTAKLHVAGAGNIALSGGAVLDGSGTNILNLSTGNFGIGSSAPPQKLYVAGTIEGQGFKLNQNPTAGYVLTSGSTGVGTWMPAASGGGSGTVTSITATSPLTGGVITTSGSIGINTTGTWNGNAVTATSLAGMTINSGTTNRSARYSAATTLDSSTKIFDDGTNIGIGTIAPRTAVELGVQALNVVGSNIGIGTTVPSRPLDITATDTGTDITAIGVVAAGTTNLSTAANTFTEYAFRSKNSAGSTGLRSKIVGVSTNNTSGSESGELHFVTRNAGTSTDKMTLTAAGNLGIGSTAPGKTLDVQGTVRSSSGFFGSGANLTGITGLISGLTTNYLAKASSATALANSTILDNGTNVGIGSTVPQSTLDVNGTITASQVNVTGAGASYTTGNLGVGSTNPGTALDVTGTIRASSDIRVGALSVCRSDGTNCPATSSQFTTVNTNDVFLPNNGNIGLGTNLTSTSALTIMNGNVGIGTWKPSQIFDVNGSARIVTNLGIGTTAPTSAIDIGNGALKISSAGVISGGSMSPSLLSGGTAGKVLIANSGGVYTGVVTTGDVGSGSTGTLTILASAVTPTKTDFSGANVGIGTVNPASQRLSIVGNVGIGTVKNGDNYINTIPPSGGLIIEGNVGISTYNPNGKFNIGGSTGMGWTVKTGSNTACNTTCPASSACVFGFDSGTVGVVNSAPVACTDATADICLCAGP